MRATGKIVVGHESFKDYTLYPHKGIEPQDDDILSFMKVFRASQTGYIPEYAEVFANWLVENYGWEIKENTIKVTIDPNKIY